MKLPPIVSKIRRRGLNALNKLTPASTSDITKLSEMIAKPPATRDAVNQWTAQVQGLVNDIVLERISKEDLASILTGLISYRSSGITPAASQQALVRAYENTSGLFQEVLHTALFEPNAQSGDVQSGLFGHFTESTVAEIVEGISNEGYFVLPSKLPQEMIERIRNESRTYSYRLKGGAKSGENSSGIDLSSPPDCISAYADSPDSPSLEAITNDPLLTRVASEYLRSPSSAIDSTFWYTFPHATPSSETAQLFHYDLDSIRWLKVFVYLSDVGSENGPHEYVAASHRPENKVPQVLLKEYARIDDQEIDQFYPGRRRQITGEAGTVIFGDTRCFHKGTSVQREHRLIFSPIYAPSRVGYFHG